MEIVGRAASSADNAQGTHFFLINDEGTYFLKRLDLPPAPGGRVECVLLRTSYCQSTMLPPASSAARARLNIAGP